MKDYIKPPRIYKAIAKAMKEWEDRHHINARSHMASAIGLRGPNAAIQLSNILNYRTYDPANPKAMKLSQLDTILEELDREDVQHILNAVADPYGLIVVSKRVAVECHKSLHEAVDLMIIEVDDVFKATKQSLADGKITTEEAERITKEAEEAELAMAEFKRKFSAIAKKLKKEQ